MPEVSVIMPAYNGGQYIGQSIESVQAQTFTDWELIIVDDGSTDNTAGIIKQYIARDPRIHYYWQENGRQGKARNKALAHIPADRPYVAFLDADDLWMPQKLDTQLRAIKHHNVDCVFCSSIVFSSENDYISLQSAEEKRFEGEQALREFIRANKIGILTALVRRQAIAAIGNFPEALPVQNTEDYCIWLKLLMNGCSLQGFAAPMAKYRVHAAASTANMLNIIRPEIALFNSLTFATDSLEHEQRMRLVGLYRMLFQKLAEAGAVAELKAAIKAFGSYTGNHRLEMLLANVLRIHLTLFKKLSWRLLGTFIK